MSLISQVISLFTGEPPNSQTQVQEDFDVSANALATRMATWPAEYNALAAQANALSTAVNGAAAAVESIGVGFEGAWSSQTGAFTLGHSVSHDRKLWIAQTTIADVTLSEPSLVNTDWMITNDNSIGFRGITTVTPVGGVVTLDISSTVNFELTLTENISFAFANIDEPSFVGSSGLVIIKQDATGGRTFTLPAVAKTPIGGATIAQVTTPNTTSTLSYFVLSDSFVMVNYIGDFQ